VEEIGESPFQRHRPIRRARHQHEVKYSYFTIADRLPSAASPPAAAARRASNI